MDGDLFEEVFNWTFESGLPAGSVDEIVLRIADMVSIACDVSAKRIKWLNKKRGVYWWNEEVANARRRCVAVRCLLTRRRRRGGNYDDLETLYRKARREFCRHIKKAKPKVWSELIQTLDVDPWGRPYKLVMGRLRRSGPTLLELLEPVVAERLFLQSFPLRRSPRPGLNLGE